MILKGKTQKGKNRIREHGDTWHLARKADSVQFDARPGTMGTRSSAHRNQTCALDSFES